MLVPLAAVTRHSPDSMRANAAIAPVSVVAGGEVAGGEVAGGVVAGGLVAGGVVAGGAVAAAEVSVLGGASCWDVHAASAARWQRTIGVNRCRIARSRYMRSPGRRLACFTQLANCVSLNSSSSRISR